MRFVSERLKRGMEQLINQPVERLGDFFFLAFVQVGQFIEEPLQFLLFRLLPPLAELLDQRR